MKKVIRNKKFKNSILKTLGDIIGRIEINL